MVKEKRSSISEHAKLIMMEIFRPLFNIAVMNFTPQKIDVEKLDSYMHKVKFGIYKDMHIFYNNPTREIFENHFKKFDLMIEEINPIGKIQNIIVCGIYDQTIKIEAEIVTMVQDGEIDIIDSKIVRVVRLRNR